MASNGAGVNLDASVPAVRFTWHNENHADAQDDGLGDYEYDLHKVWSCMGRAGVNGVMRAGFVEEGDPYNGWPAGWIEENAGGVYSTFNRWDSLVGYNPLGGIGAGDFTIFGALAPPTGAALHLDAPLGVQPAFTIEYLATGAVWAAATVVRTPDFTQANGRALQRVEITAATNWPAQQIGSAPGPYYFFRLKNTNAVLAGPLANQAYKDWLYGYFKHVYCHYDLKKGDDTADSTFSGFRHNGLFGIRFRAGFGWTSDTIGGRFQLGDLDVSGKQIRPKDPWYSISTKAPFMVGIKAYGGLLAGKARFDGETPNATLRSFAVDGEMVSVLVMGWSGAMTIGAGSTAAMKRLDFVRVTPSYVVPANGTIANFNIDSSGVARDVVIDVLHGASQAYAVRSTIASAKIEGLRFTDDDVSQGQILFTGGGYKNLYGVEWASGTKKISGFAVVGSQTMRVWRRLDLTIWDDGDVTHPAAGIPCRITDSAAQVQLSNGVFDANGTYSLGNTLPSAPGAGEINKNIIAASEWFTDGVETSLDTYLTIEINPSDMAGYNSAYSSLILTARMARALVYDLNTSAYVLADYQPAQSHIHISLPLSVVPAAPVNPDVLVSTVQIPAASEMRFEGPVPEVV